MDCHSPDPNADSRLFTMNIRAMVFAHDAPVRRLERDVHDITRFLDPDCALAQRKLREIDPPFTDAAAEVVDRSVMTLLRHENRQGETAVLHRIARLGPVSMAEGIVMLDDHRRLRGRLANELAWEFRKVFIRYPELFLGDAREVLGQFTLRPLI